MPENIVQLNEAAKTVERGIEETLAYYDFPAERWRHIGTNKRMILTYKTSTADLLAQYKLY